MKNNKTAIWVLTQNGFDKALDLSKALHGITVYLPSSLEVDDYCDEDGFVRFSELKHEIINEFNNFSAHIFFMATGIVVRLISGLLVSKVSDPAVVVLDDKGINAISLISGHIGEANKLTYTVSEILGSNPVITTATDINKIPAIDVFASENDLYIENPNTIKHVNMAFLKNRKVYVYDPYGFLSKDFNYSEIVFEKPENLKKPAVYIDYKKADINDDVLILRPRMLTVGIGCNRGTDHSEINDLLEKNFEDKSFSIHSIKNLATIDIKNDETGILETGEKLNIPILFFSREELDNVKGIQNPSLMVEKHIGVKSVCEAAAIRSAKMGKLLIQKNSTKNVTIAAAEISILQE